jgi:membrane-associated phospholipid phosphatase
MPASASAPDRRLPDPTIAPLAAAVALGVVAALGAALGTAGVQRVEQGVQRLALSAQSPALHGVFLGATIAGGLTAMRVLALAGALLLLRRAGPRSAATLVATPFVAELFCDALKRLYARPRPAGLGQGVDPTYSYPSAHAMVSAATCAVIAWLCWRTGIVPARAASAFAMLVPLVVGASRLFLNVHWTADVIGGWSGGLAIASLVIALDRSQVPRAMPRASSPPTTVP